MNNTLALIVTVYGTDFPRHASEKHFLTFHDSLRVTRAEPPYSGVLFGDKQCYLHFEGNNIQNMSIQR